MTGERSEATVIAPETEPTEVSLVDRIRRAHDETSFEKYGSPEWLVKSKAYQAVVKELLGRHVIFSGQYDTVTPDPKNFQIPRHGVSTAVESQEAVVTWVQVEGVSSDPELSLKLIDGEHERGYTTVGRVLNQNLVVLDPVETEQAA